MDKEFIKKVLENCILASPKALSVHALANLFSPPIPEARIREYMEELLVFYNTHAFRLQEKGGGFSFVTVPETAEYVKKIAPSKSERLTKIESEILAVIAYCQPVSRKEIESMRGGKDCFGPLVSLADKNLISTGRIKKPGAPAMYMTTGLFLERFDLKSLAELPDFETSP